MACVHHLPREDDMENKKKEDDVSSLTLDGTVDRHGRPAVRGKSGKWIAGTVILLNQGLATLAFFGVGVNLVLFLTRVIGQETAEAANNVSKWTGTVYIFSLAGAFLSESYWGRFKTCVIFQLIFILGLSSLSITSHFLLVAPQGCGGNARYKCRSHSPTEIALFYLCIYLVALGNGGYQPNIATFGADQFDKKDDREESSKVAFFSYFYLAMNLGSLFSNTVLGYFEDEGLWVFGFWVSTASAVAALAIFLLGIPRYRHFRQSGNPVSRLCQVIVAAVKKWRVSMPKDGRGLYEVSLNEDSTAPTRTKQVVHTRGFKFLDRAAYLSSEDVEEKKPWRVCPISQVEEVKCILRLLPIWLCTILYSVVFTQMASLFVEQGAAMRTDVKGFRVPPSSMSSFDILSVTCFVFLYRRVIDPVVSTVKKKDGEGKGGSGNGLSELQRMGMGLVVAVMAMVAAATVECYRLRNAIKEGSSSLSILWQIPQYSLIGVSEVFMYVSQLEFFNEQAPDGLKSFGSAFCMTSISLGNYVSSLMVSMVNTISGGEHTEGWISGDLNKGHLDRFFFLLALLTTVDLFVYITCAKWYKCIKPHSKYGQDQNQNQDDVKMKEIEIISSSS